MNFDKESKSEKKILVVVGGGGGGGVGGLRVLKPKQYAILSNDVKATTDTM